MHIYQNMNDKIKMAVQICIVLIALAFISTPVAAANVNLIYNMNPVINQDYKTILPSDMGNVYKNPKLHYTPITDFSAFNPASTVSSVSVSSVNPFVIIPIIRWKVCG